MDRRIDLVLNNKNSKYSLGGHKKIDKVPSTLNKDS